MYESTPHSGGYYHANQTYWANGALNVLTGPGSYYISYGVDAKGRLYSATASQGQNPLTSTTYSVADLPQTVSFGSGDSDSFSYDSSTNRMTQYSFSVNGQSLVGNLTWNAIGTLETLAVTDPFNSADAQTCNYTHDDLTRIASANCGSVWSQTFSYDAFGNLSKNGTISFQPTYSASTNQMTSIGSQTPSYDSNGNVTNDFLNTYAWDANNRPVTADSVGLTYDALGRMVEQNRSGAYTEIMYAPTGFKMELMNGQSYTKAFVPLAGGSMAVYTSGTLYYRHSDWIGSSRLASTSARAIYSDGAYAPFGEPYAQTGTSDLSFTGQNQDTASNLYDFPAREYGTQGRWPSPDPAGISSVHLRDPQTWNRYAYARNNPMVLTDPTGMYLPCRGNPCVGDWGDDGGACYMCGGAGFGSTFDDYWGFSIVVWDVPVSGGGDPGNGGDPNNGDQGNSGGSTVVPGGTLVTTPAGNVDYISNNPDEDASNALNPSSSTPTLSVDAVFPDPVPQGSDGIGIVIVYLATDQNGPLAQWYVTENVSVQNATLSGQLFPGNPYTGSAFTTSTGLFEDKQSDNFPFPFSTGVAQTITLTNVLQNFQPQYDFTFGYIVQGTGTNQGFISGTNGVSYVH